VTIGAKSLVLTGSNVTRNVPPNHTVGGAPAKDMTDRLVPYRTVTPEEKLTRIQEYVKELLDARYRAAHEPVDRGFRVRSPEGEFRVLFGASLTETEPGVPPERPLLAFTCHSELAQPPENVTVFDLVTRQYVRTRSKPEIEMMRFLRSYRARFVPADRPRLVAPEL